MRIAVIGAGISGLTAAHELARDGHDVTVFEAGSYAGGHTNTIDVEDPRGPLAVDTGFIVFNDRNYPGFEALLDELGVASQPSDMSFGVSDDAGRFEYAASSPNALYAQRRHLVDPRFQRMVLEYARFNREARRLLASADDEPSLAGWLADRGFSDYFVQRLIVPQAAAVWSADPGAMDAFPARFLLEFFDNHGMLGFSGRPSWRVVAGGSKRYVEALLRRFPGTLHLDAPVAGVERFADRVEVPVRGSAPMAFDHVVVAAHADQALELLRDPSPLERELLGTFPYQANEAVLHTDVRVLPRRRRAWASWNFHLGATSGPAQVSYWMNRLQTLDAGQDYVVTLNRTAAIDPATVIRTIPYAHPVYTLAARAAQARHAEVNTARTSFCGAYWGWGFHEDGLQSAHRAVAAIRARATEEAVAA